jgi:predicted ATPase/DNA-binding SARP family transcriptional activator
MPHLKMGLLGPLQVALDNSPIASFGSDKARALLIYLATEADRPHRREKLTGLLWPDCPENTARHNLRQILFSIRQAIGDHKAQPPFLIVTRGEIQFNAASNYSLDVAEFNAHLAVKNAHQHPQSTLCGECASHLQQAIDLYRGKFLDQFFLEDSAEFEEWALIQREALHRSVLDALFHLVGYYEACADLAQARRCASRQLELDPWREEAHRQMMGVLAMSGQRSEALVQYETCRRVLADELGAEPSAETRELHAQISRGDWALQPRETLSICSTTLPPLPLPLTPFIGREHELTELGHLIADPQCRLITLMGIGGMGKTRLALQAADRHRDAFSQGAVFIPLAAVDSSERIVSAIAEALGLVVPGSRDPRDIVLGYLQDKQMLLVLDNLEHLRDGAGLLVDILQRAPGVKLLCTSREALHLLSEWVYEVQGLAVPDGERVDRFEQYGAVALFVQRAQRSRVGYALTTEERPGVARICHVVGGMPLALELAASWTRILSSQEIADQIERDIHFLTSSMRDLPERHRAMHAVFDASWGMLTPEEQGVLSKLTVVRGGLSRPAAEQVAGASLSVLASLVSKSLMRRIGWARYDLHELVRQYACARLAADPQQEAAARGRHGEYYLALVRERESRLCSHDQKSALMELAAEIANIRLALEWAIDTHQTALLREVSFPLLYLYEIRGWYREAESIFCDAAAKLGTLETDAEHERDRQIAQLDMQTNQAYFAFRIGRIAEAYGMLRRCSEQLRSLGDQTVLRYALRYCGIAAQPLGKLDEAELSLNESRELSQTVNRPWDVGIDNVYLGSVARVRGALDRAQPYLRKALEISRKLGDPRLLAVSLNGLGFVLLSLNQPTQARELAEEALSLAQETGDRYDLALSMVLLGDVAGHLGDPAEAHLLFEKSITLLLETGDTGNVIGTYCRQGHLALSMDKAREAESHFRAAASLAMQGGSEMLTLNALAGLANARARMGAAVSAMELVMLILHYPSRSSASRDLAEHLRRELEAQLSPEQIQALELRVRAETLEGIVQRLGAGSIDPS